MQLTSTQFPGSTKSGQQDVVIGLDFGTSSSKVVIRNQTIGEAFTVTFDEIGHPSNKYLLPTRPYFDLQGHFQQSTSEDKIPLRELKGHLMGKIVTPLEFIAEQEIVTDAETLAIAYLAKVIQLSRQWYLRYKRTAYSNYKINWQLNIGMPSIGKESKEKSPFFKELATNAWWLSTQSGIITLENSKKARTYLGTSIPALQDISPSDINVVPEVVAEVIGYAHSDRRKEGLHLLIDIGAGTVDLASFVLGEEAGGDRYSILTGSVDWIGAFELHKARIEIVKDKILTWLKDYGNFEDPVKPIPTSLSTYLPTNDSIAFLDYRENDSDVFKKCKQLFNKTIVYLRKNRDPNSPKWKTGVPIFLCGGGAQIKFYVDAITEANEYWLGSTAGVNPEQLQKPEDLDMGDLKPEEFFRIAVAYGLSLPSYNIGTYYGPDEIPDVPMDTPVSKDFGGAYIDKDQM